MNDEELSSLITKFEDIIEKSKETNYMYCYKANVTDFRHIYKLDEWKNPEYTEVIKDIIINYYNDNLLNLIELNEEMYIKLVKEDIIYFEDFPRKIFEKYPKVLEECSKISIIDIPIEKYEENINLFCDIIRKDGSELRLLKKEFILQYPQLSLAAIENGNLLFVPKEHQIEFIDKIVERLKGDIHQLCIDMDVLQQFPKYVKELVNTHHCMYIIENLNEEFQMNHPDILVEVVKNNPDLYDSMHPSAIQKYPEITKTLIDVDGYNLRNVSHKIFKEHPEIALYAARRGFVNFLPEEFQYLVDEFLS